MRRMGDWSRPFTLCPPSTSLPRIDQLDPAAAEVRHVPGRDFGSSRASGCRNLTVGMMNRETGGTAVGRNHGIGSGTLTIEDQDASGEVLRSGADSALARGTAIPVRPHPEVRIANGWRLPGSRVQIAPGQVRCSGSVGLLLPSSGRDRPRGCEAVVSARLVGFES